MPNAPWEPAPLGSLVSFEYGKGLPAEIRTNQGYPVLGSSGKVGKHSDFLVEGPGIVIGRKGTVGSITWVDTNFWPIDTTYYIESKQPLDIRWLYWKLHTLGLDRLDSSTGVPGLNRNDAYGFSVEIPEQKEQHRIAEILDTIDDAIQKTEQLIAKLKQIKQGLLHDLLTRGINENGQLRDHITQPEQFKDSVLGRVPASWNTLDVGDVLEGVIDFRGRTPKKIGMDWGGGNIPALSANNVEMGQINLSKETYYGSEKLYSKWMTSGDAACGDVVMTLEAPLGNIAQIPDDRRYILSQRTILLKTRSDLVDNDFLRYQLMSDQFQRTLVRESTGTTATGIQRAKIGRAHV